MTLFWFCDFTVLDHGTVFLRSNVYQYCLEANVARFLLAVHDFNVFFYSILRNYTCQLSTDFFRLEILLRVYLSKDVMFSLSKL